jgi:hypothetical protein
MNGDDDTADFDPTRTLTVYRNIIEERDASSDETEKAELDRLAGLLRDAWKDWQGEDSLHEAAFSHPVKPPADEKPTH